MMIDEAFLFGDHDQLKASIRGQGSLPTESVV